MITKIRTSKIGNHQNHKATKFVAKNLLIFAIAITLFIPSSVVALVTDITPVDNKTDSDVGFELDDPRSVTTFTVGGTTYAIVGSLTSNGVQIINLSVPGAITAEDFAANGEDFPNLGNPVAIDTFTVDDVVYAIVASNTDNGVQIINLSVPGAITAEDNVDTGGDFQLGDVRDVATFTVNDTVYAITASSGSNGVTIINLSNPAIITAEDSANHLVNGFLFGNPRGVDTFTVEGTVYAIVASISGDRVQIINLSNPAIITAEDSKSDSDVGFLLNGAIDVATFTVSGTVYAIVASTTGDTVQIINVNDPENITAVDNATHGNEGFLLDGAIGVDIFESDNTYAIVTSNIGNTVQIIDLSDPGNITAVDNATTGGDFLLNGATGVDTFTVGGTVYAIVAAEGSDAVQIIELGPATQSTPTLESTLPSTPSATPSSLNSAS